MTLFDVPHPFAASPGPEPDPEPVAVHLEPLDGLVWVGPDFLREDLVPLSELRGAGAAGDPEIAREALAARGQLRPVLVGPDRREILGRGHLVEAARALGWTHVAVRLKLADDLADGNGQITFLDVLDPSEDLAAFAPKEGWREAEDEIDGINDASRDPDHEWVGLPAFVPVSDALRVVISLETEEDREAFFDALGISTIHKGTRGTLSVWWPERVKKDLASLRFTAKGDG